MLPLPKGYYAVAADCLYNKPNFALPKYQAFLKQTAADIEYSSLRKDVERRLKKITPKKRSRRR